MNLGGTIGRGAQRESETTDVMHKLVEKDTDTLLKSDTMSLYKDLESLDQIIYKEGRIKRKRQNLLDSLSFKLKSNSEDYDELLELTTSLV